MTGWEGFKIFECMNKRETYGGSIALKVSLLISMDFTLDLK